MRNLLEGGGGRRRKMRKSWKKRDDVDAAGRVKMFEFGGRRGSNLWKEKDEQFAAGAFQLAVSLIELGSDKKGTRIHNSEKTIATLPKLNIKPR